MKCTRRNIAVDARIEFNRAGSTEVWYRLDADVHPYSDPTNMPTDAWINVRMVDVENRQPADMYEYIKMDSVTGTGDPCLNHLNPPAENEPVTFYYDRVAAIKYAMAHAYRNSEPVSSGTVYLDGGEAAGRVTNRIANNVDTTIEQGEIPYVNEIPYFYFRHDISFAEFTDKTGSAVFSSQAIWMGGMSMTTDSTREVDCLQPVFPQGIETTHGWRYCNQQQDSRVFRNHDGIVAFFSEAASGGGYPNNIEILNGQRGTFAANIKLTWDGEYAPIVQCVREIAGRLRDSTDGGSRLQLPDNQENLFKLFTGELDCSAREDFVEGDFTQIRLGDYVWTERDTKPVVENCSKSVYHWGHG